VTVDSPEALVPDDEIPGENHGTVAAPQASRRETRRAKAAQKVTARAGRRSAAEARAVQKTQDKAKRSRRSLGYWLIRLLRKAWMPLVILAVMAVAAFTVDRLHGVFGKTETTRPGSGLSNDPAPFDPKTVVYEIFGPPGSVATVNYLNLDAEPQIARDVVLPWSVTLTTNAPAAAANIVAQGNSDTIGCRITVDGEVKDERVSTGVSAQTFCIVKSG
jgi:hypothetical protein